MPSVSAVESLVSGALKSTLKAAQKSYSFLNKKQLSRKERKKEKKLQRKLQRQFSFRSNNNNNHHNSSSSSSSHQQERQKDSSTSAGCSSSKIDDSLVGNKHIRKFDSNNKNQHHQKTKFQLNKTGNFQNKGNIFKRGKKLHHNNNQNHHNSLVNGNTHNDNDRSPGKFVKLHNHQNNNNNNNNSGISNNNKKINKYVNNNNNLSLKSPSKSYNKQPQQGHKFRRGSDSSSSEEEEEVKEKKLLSIQQKKEQLSEEEVESDSDSELENCNNTNNVESEPLEFTKSGPQVSPFILTIRSKYLCLNSQSPSKVKEEKGKGGEEEKENHKTQKSTSSPSTTTTIVNGHHNNNNNKNTKESSLLLNKSTTTNSTTSTTTNNNNNNNTDSSKKNKTIQNELPASSGLKSKALSSRMNGNSSSNIVNGGSSSGTSSQHPVPRLAEPKYVLFHRDQVKPGWDQSTRYPVGSGLINLGNTCYLNATLQALLHTPAFVNWLLNDKDHEKKCKLNNQLIQQCTICAMSKTLLEAYKSPNCAPIRPMPIYSKLKSICKHFQHGRQEDAHEFLRYLLESMERSYLNAVNGQKLDNRSKETTPLSQIFGGYIRTEVTCLKCQYVSTTFQPLAELQLDIRHVSTLEDAIQNHFKKERLDYNDYKCEKCHTSSPATKQFSLEIPPIVLCLQLKRFTLYGTKINKPIHCNRALNLNSYINKAIRSENNVEAHYRLVGLVTHIGSSPNCGHYTAIASASNGQFYQFDDSYVRQCSFNAAQNSDAYVIIYEIDRSKSNHHHNNNNINISRPTSTVTSNSFAINKQPQTTVKTSSNSQFNPSKSPTSTNHFMNTSSSSPSVPPSSRTPPPPSSKSVSPRPDVKVNGLNGVDIRFNNNNNKSGSSSSSINNSFNKNHINNNSISSSNQSKLKLTNGSSTNGLLVKEAHKNITININNKQLSNLYSNNNSTSTNNGESTTTKSTTSPSSSSVNRSQSSSGSKLVNGNIDSKDQFKSSSSNSNNNNNKLPNGEINNKTSTSTTGNSSSSSISNNNKSTKTATTTTSSDNSMVLLKTKLLSNGDNNYSGKNKINTSNNNNNNSTNTNPIINSKLVNGDVKLSNTTITNNNNHNGISKKLGHSENKVKRVNNEVGIAKVKSSGSLQLVPYDDEDERVTMNGGGSTYKNDTNSSYGITSISTPNEFPKKNTSKLVRPIPSSSTSNSSSTTAFPSLWNKDNKIKTWNGGPSVLNSCITAERKRAFEKTKEELEDEEIDSGRVKKKPKSDSPTAKPLISFDDISRQRAASRNHVM